MVEILNYVSDLGVLVIDAVLISLSHNWLVLLFAILIAVVLKTYVNSEKLSKLLLRNKRLSIVAGVLFGAFTPLCACGTTAVIIGMLTTTMPWGPVMAFLTSSPLMSPDGFVMLTGVIGIRFAIAMTVASLFIGITSGFATNIREKKTNLLTGQSRFVGKEQPVGCSCNAPKPVLMNGCSCAAPTPATNCSCAAPAADCSCTVAVEPACSCAAVYYKSGNHIVNLENITRYCCERTEKLMTKLITKFKLRAFLTDLYQLGLKQILLFYCVFVAIGFLINYFVPSSIITVLFGANSLFAVPLASMIGLPLYITTESGIPIIQSMIANGASEGAMLAFMITGSATSAWVIAGLATFLKKRAIALYVMFVLLGGIISGYLLDLVGLFI